MVRSQRNSSNAAGIRYPWLRDSGRYRAVPARPVAHRRYSGSCVTAPFFDDLKEPSRTGKAGPNIERPSEQEAHNGPESHAQDFERVAHACLGARYDTISATPPRWAVSAELLST